MRLQEDFQQFLSLLVFLVISAQDRRRHFVLGVLYLSLQMHPPPLPTRGRLNSMDAWFQVFTPLGFPDDSSGKEPDCQCRRRKRCGFNPWVGKIPLEEGMATHSSKSCPENSMDRGAWQATVHRVAKKSDMTEATQQAHTHLPPWLPLYWAVGWS